MSTEMNALKKKIDEMKLEHDQEVKNLNESHDQVVTEWTRKYNQLKTDFESLANDLNLARNENNNLKVIVQRKFLMHR